MTHGRDRTLGIALDGSLKLDLRLETTPRTLIYDRDGRLRGSFDEPTLHGSALERQADQLLDRLYAEDERRRLDSAPVPR